MDWCVSALDVLPRACDIAKGRIAIYTSGGLRRGTDLLKAVALGADGVLAARAPVYGVCAAGVAGAKRALKIIEEEELRDMGLLGARTVGELGPALLERSR